MSCEKNLVKHRRNKPKRCHLFKICFMHRGCLAHARQGNVHLPLIKGEHHFNVLPPPHHDLTPPVTQELRPKRDVWCSPALDRAPSQGSQTRKPIPAAIPRFPWESKSLRCAMRFTTHLGDLRLNSQAQSLGGQEAASQVFLLTGTPIEVSQPFCPRV